MKIDFNEMNKFFGRRFPELMEKYQTQEENSAGSEFLAYIFCEDFFSPQLESLISTGEPSPYFFENIELLSSNGDQKTLALISIGVFDYFNSSEVKDGFTQKLEKYPAALSLYKEHVGYMKNLPRK